MNSIVDQIKAIARSHGTAYRISQVIAAETDPDKSTRMAIEKRWQKWGNGQNLERLKLLEDDLANLCDEHGNGYEIVIRRIKQ